MVKLILKRTLGFVFSIFIFFLLICCFNRSKNLIVESDSSLPIKTESLDENQLFSRSETTATENIEISNDMLEAVLLTRNYYDEFSNETNFVEIDNKLFHDFKGGTELTLDEFKSFISKLDDDYSLKKYYEKKINDENFTMNSRGFDDPSYVLKADIDNDGYDEIFIGAFDMGSLYNAWTIIYKLSDNCYKVVFATTQNTVYRIVNFNGKNFLFLPILKTHETEESGFDIVFFGGDGLESYYVSRDKIEEIDVFIRR